MLTKEDDNFIKYWSNQRLNKKGFMRKASLGMPLATLIFFGLAISLVAAWFSRKANPVLQDYTSIIITVMLAGFGIVFFISYFSARHKWEMNELHYHELLRKKEEEEMQQADRN